MSTKDPSLEVKKQKRVGLYPAEPLHQAPQTPHMPDEFEHLLRWQDTAENDEIIDLAVEDTVEEEEHTGWADVAQTEDETEVPCDEREPPGQSSLTDEEVIEIINERINFYIDSWRPNSSDIQGEEVAYDVDAMWDEAEASGQRLELAQKHERDYAYYSYRLDKLCDEIRSYPGNNADQVRLQCRNLEVTVQLMELAGWLRDIYSLEPVPDGDELSSPTDAAASNTLPPEPKAVAHDVIDLDSLSETLETGASASALEKHIVDQHHAPQGSTRIIPYYGDEPENASVSSVRRWKWCDLVEHLDRKRVVSKALFEMDANDRESLRSRLRLIGRTGILREVAACVDMLRRGESTLQNILPRDMHKIVSLTNLFLSWWFCRNYFKEPNASIEDLTVLKLCMENGSAETSTFYHYLCTIMQTTFSERALQHPEQPSQAEIIEISDDDS